MPFILLILIFKQIMRFKFLGIKVMEFEIDRVFAPREYL